MSRELTREELDRISARIAESSHTPNAYGTALEGLPRTLPADLVMRLTGEDPARLYYWGAIVGSPEIHDLELVRILERIQSDG